MAYGVIAGIDSLLSYVYRDPNRATDTSQEGDTHFII